MRIMYIAFAHSSHTLKWIEYFRGAGHQIMLVSFYPPREPIQGINLRYLEIANKNLAFLKVPEVKRLIRQFKPDILHAHYATSCGLVGALSGFHPYVLSVWGDDILEFPRKSPLHRWIARKSLRSADYITATSAMLKKETLKLLGDFRKDISIVPFGVDVRWFKYHVRKPQERVHIGTVRSFTSKYGLEYLIRAFGSLSERYGNLRLTLVGDGRLRPKLESLAHAMVVKDRVFFPGRVANQEVARYLRDFDIFVMPSVGGGETFGVAAVEGMATGLPVVASRVGGLPEVVDDGQTGILVPPADVEALKAALEFYILSPEARLEHGQKGRAKVEALYNWQENASLMANLYERILSTWSHRA